MVKRGGTRVKIPIAKIARKESRATAFTKRRYGLFSKASQLCLLSGGAQIAVLATPPSSLSDASFYSFGHSSVDAVVSAFLAGKRPVPVKEETREEDIGICLARKDLGLPLWWEDERLLGSENPGELTAAIDSMARMLKELRSRNRASVIDNSIALKNNEMKKSDLVSQEPDQTLIFQSNSPVCCIPDDDSTANLNKITEEQDQILSICESFSVAEKNNNNALTGNLDGYEQEMDIDQLIDFETIFDDGVFVSAQELQEFASDDASMVTKHIALDEDNLRFSDVIN